MQLSTNYTKNFPKIFELLLYFKKLPLDNKMKKIYILKVGETFETTKKYYGDFDIWIKNSVTLNNRLIETIDVLNNEPFPDFEDILGVIITGSHAMVTQNNPWSVKTEKWILQAQKRGIFILGICYGHQLICKALGGVVENNPKGKEIGTVQIFSKNERKSDALFHTLPENFYAHVTHMQSALTLPKNAVALASNLHDEHQIVRFSPTIWGVQFHPEFDCAVMKSYIKEQKEELESYGFSLDKLLYGVATTKISNAIIEKFVQMLQNHQECKIAS